jgi:hypothetical protein
MIAEWCRGKAFVSRDTGALLFVAFCWIASIILVNPIGEFPSVDDWAYLTSVRTLVERGEIVLSDWSAPNLISQVFWGALFSLPFGVSYTALRISTLVVALLGAFALFKLMREAQQSIALSILGALLFLFNPIFFVLSFTFMTDVPFLAAQTGSMLFLVIGLRAASASASAFGWFLAVVAQLCRQTGIAIPFAYGGAYLAKHGWSIKRAAIAVLPLVAFLALQWAYAYWLESTGRMPLNFSKQMQTALPILTGSPLGLAYRVFEVALYVFFYLGLFLLPLSLPVMATIIATVSRAKIAAAIGGIAALTGLLSVISLRAGLVMPVWPHTWRATGLGFDSYGGVMPPPLILTAMTFLAVFGGVLLVACIGRAIYLSIAKPAAGGGSWALAFGLLGGCALAGMLSLVVFKYDRYLLPIVPWLALCVSLAAPIPSAPRWSILLGGMLVVFVAGYSIINVHNYVAEKRATAQAIDGLVSKGIPRELIDGTWPFNGHAQYGRFASKRIFRGWYRKRDFVIGFKTEPERPLLARYPVARWSLLGSRGRGDLLVFGPRKGSK